MEDTAEKQIRAFLERFFEGYALEYEEDIFAAGFVNSLFAVQLIVFLEKEFSVEISDADLDLDNFRSIGRMIRFLEAKAEATT